jgi:hypothetical protein
VRKQVAKKVRKKHNPKKRYNAVLLSRAETCLFYRWESAGVEKNEYTAQGPYSTKQNEEIMMALANHPNRWLIQVIAAYIDENADYYEEEETLDPTNAISIATNATKVRALAEGAIKRVGAVGNPKHYIDTFLVLRPFTPGVVKKLNDLAWQKNQIKWRAEAFEKLQEQEQIQKLEALLT